MPGFMNAASPEISTRKGGEPPVIFTDRRMNLPARPSARVDGFAPVPGMSASETRSIRCQSVSMRPFTGSSVLMFL